MKTISCLFLATALAIPGTCLGNTNPDPRITYKRTRSNEGLTPADLLTLMESKINVNLSRAKNLSREDLIQLRKTIAVWVVIVENTQTRRIFLDVDLKNVLNNLQSEAKLLSVIKENVGQAAMSNAQLFYSNSTNRSNPEDWKSLHDLGEAIIKTNARLRNNENTFFRYYKQIKDQGPNETPGSIRSKILTLYELLVLYSFKDDESLISKYQLKYTQKALFTRRRLDQDEAGSP